VIRGVCERHEDHTATMEVVLSAGESARSVQRISGDTVKRTVVSYPRAVQA